MVSEVVDEKLPYDKLPELRARMAEVPFSENVDLPIIKLTSDSRLRPT